MNQNHPDLKSVSTRPMIEMWFGNFFEPFYSDRESVRRGMEEIARLGCTTVNLDSKPWEDFFSRYAGGEASPYVAMQEFMMAEAQAHGLDYTHLAIYLCGDNLYPTIRDVPPVRGEESVLANGELMGTYKYWSARAQRTMVDHVKGLLKLYGPGMRRRSGPTSGIVIQTMFDPIVKPSFDEEGRTRYLAWLEKKYAGDMARLTKLYGISVRSFSDLTPAQYWLRPEALSPTDCACPNPLDFDSRSPDFHRWIDNQTYLAMEMKEFFRTMQQSWREIEPALFLEPVLHQWGYFFNPPGHSYWSTGKRALDVYRLAPYVDGVLYIAAPLNAENLPDAMALGVEGSIMRSASNGRAFTAGLYLGRHVNGDIYRAVPPAEAIGTLVANGASGFHLYGYSGLDDGGVLFRMDDLFKESLRVGNTWALEVIPRLQEPRTKEVAILFPAEMSLYEPPELDPAGRHRMDLLGWYEQLVDLGWHVDILHPVQANALADYQFIVVPHNSLYDLGDNSALEAAVRAFVMNGGTVLHGPHCELARRAFGIEEKPMSFDCISWGEPKVELIPHGWSTVTFDVGEPLGRYIQSQERAITQNRFGKGRVLSFGFQYGYAYSRRTMPVVPPRYGRREMHPIILLKETPVAAMIGCSPLAPVPARKGIEIARFGRRIVMVNHRASPIDIRSFAAQSILPQLPMSSSWLAAHSAVLIEE